MGRLLQRNDSPLFPHPGSDEDREGMIHFERKKILFHSLTGHATKRERFQIIHGIVILEYLIIDWCKLYVPATFMLSEENVIISLDWSKSVRFNLLLYLNSTIS